jgi:arylsulfatase A-like enzyme
MEPNVILLICDGLRRDVPGLYGGEAKMPFLDSLAKDAMVYENALTPAPHTFPAHISLFTGLYASQHGVHETDKLKLLDLISYSERLEAERLAESLSKKGYNTFGISNNIVVSPFTGFDKGFNNYICLDPAPKTKEEEIFSEARKLGSSPGAIAKVLIKRGQFRRLFAYVRAWRRINKINRALNYPIEKGSSLVNDILENCKFGDKFFAFINLIEMHEPYPGYNPKETWDNFTGVKKTSDKKVAYLKRQYLLEAEHLDQAIGRMVKTLKEREVYDNTMLIITSDHGQAFNEHGYMYHGTPGLNEEMARIPLIIKYPNQRKFKKKEGYQSLVNIKRLIHSIIEGGDDSVLTKEVEFSETYGTVVSLPGGYESRKKYVEDTYERVMKSVYKDGYKLTVDGTGGTVSEFLKGKDEIDIEDAPEEAKELLKEIARFKVEKDFKMPDI